jgi:hypothetical protein
MMLIFSLRPGSISQFHPAAPRCSERGKPLTKDDWKSMRSLIHDFNFDLGSVDVFDEDEKLNTRLSTMTEC